MKPIGIALLAGALLAVAATPALAQYVVSAKSGTVNFTEGQVQLDGHSLESSITHYPDIKEGSVLSTTEGRAEILLTPGVTLRLGDHASLKMISNRLIDARVELLGGKAVIEAAQIDKDSAVTIVVRKSAVSLLKAGIYRFNFEPAQLKVYKGEASVLSDSDSRLIGAGKICDLGVTEVAVKKFETADTDELDHWSQRRAELMAMANISGAGAFSSGGGFFGSGYLSGMAMPMMGCNGFGYMPSFGYAGATWGFLNPFGGYAASGMWGYNPWYDMYTFIPCSGIAYSPYGYQFQSPVRVVASSNPPPSGVVHRPIHPPMRGPMSLARAPMALAVNGSHTPAFRGGTGIAHGNSSAAAGHNGFAGYGGGFASRGGSPSGGGFSSSGASSGGGASAGSAGHAGGGGFAGGGGGGGRR